MEDDNKSVYFVPQNSLTRFVTKTNDNLWPNFLNKPTTISDNYVISEDPALLKKSLYKNRAKPYTSIRQAMRGRVKS